jgi:hypothetical protein
MGRTIPKPINMSNPKGGLPAPKLKRHPDDNYYIWEELFNGSKVIVGTNPDYKPDIKQCNGCGAVGTKYLECEYCGNIVY